MVVHFVEQETGAMMKSVPQTLLLLLLLEGLTSWMSSSSIEVASACGGGGVSASRECLAVLPLPPVKSRPGAAIAWYFSSILSFFSFFFFCAAGNI